MNFSKTKKNSSSKQCSDFVSSLTFSHLGAGVQVIFDSTLRTSFPGAGYSVALY